MNKIRELQKIKEKEDMIEYTFKPDISKTTKKKSQIADMNNRDLEQEHDSKAVSNYKDDYDQNYETNLRNSR